MERLPDTSDRPTGRPWMEGTPHTPRVRRTLRGRSLAWCCAAIVSAALGVIGEPSRSASQDAPPDGDWVTLHSLCAPPPARHVIYAPEPGRSRMHGRIVHSGLAIAECSGEGAECGSRLRAPRGRVVVELECDEWQWREEVSVTGRELSFVVGARSGRPTLELQSRAEGTLRLELAEPRDGIAVVPGRARPIVLVNRGRVAVTARGRIERWNGTWWWDMSIDSTLPHDVFPLAPVVPPHGRAHVPLPWRVVLQRDARYRIVVEAHSSENAGAIAVHRSSEVNLEIAGRRLLE